MTDKAYIAAYKKLASQYDDSQLRVEDYLAGIQESKVEYLKGKTGTVLPVISQSAALQQALNWQGAQCLGTTVNSIRS